MVDDGVRLAEQRADTFGEVGEGVTVLGKHDELSAW